MSCNSEHIPSGKSENLCKCIIHVLIVLREKVPGNKKEMVWNANNFFNFSKFYKNNLFCLLHNLSGR